LTTVQSQFESSAKTVPLLTIVLPVYNARDRIESTLTNLKSKLKDLETHVLQFHGAEHKHLEQLRNSQGSDWSFEEHMKDWYEIIVVNDGSVDGTRGIVENMMGDEDRIRVISYDTNMGKGYAIRRGILESQGRYVIFMDGDGDIQADILANYMQSLEQADIVIASKYHPGSVVKVPKSRRFLSRCFNIFVKTLIPLRVSDTQVGLKAGRGDAFRVIFGSVLVKRYAFDVELLAVANLLGLKIVEMPVKIELDGCIRKEEIVKMALDVLGVAYRLRISRWYQKNLIAFLHR
jgi:glycosyltransferase involved in cell wall biosynthesis